MIVGLPHTRPDTCVQCDVNELPYPTLPDILVRSKVNGSGLLQSPVLLMALTAMRSPAMAIPTMQGSLA